MTKTYKNAVLKQMLDNLQPVLSQKGKVGYAAARNTRKIKEALTEYVEKESELFEKYGTPEKNENGEETGRIIINANDPKCREFVEEITPLANIEHEVEIMKLSYEEVMDVLTGDEMLAIEWMLED